MRRNFLASVVLTSVALLNVTPSPAQSVTYSVLGATSSSNPVAALIQAQDGRLYGTAEDQNANTGLAFSTSLGGTFNFGLYSFQGGTDGGLPVGPVVQAPNGTFYGAADFGGAMSSGVIYSIVANAGTGSGKETPIYPFAGASDGCQPQSSLIFDNAGNLYGTTPCGGANGHGAVFKYNLGSGALTPIHAFCAQANCPDGDAPQAGMVQGSDGNFYGTASGGNASGNGVIYRLSTSGTYTLLYTFCGAAGCADGAAPQGPLVENSDGNFYGATAQGGAFGHGTVFRMTPGGSVTTLYSFTGAADGSAPLGTLVVGSDGNLYGATELGGSQGFGTIYRITPAGSFASLHSFTDSNGDSNPKNGLVQASDGNFYGTTSGLIHDSAGAVYKMAMSPAMAAPVQLAFSTSTGKAGAAATLTWTVHNAFSQTLQNCYASVQGGSAGAGTWSGQQAGTYSAATGLFSGSAQVTPTAAGTYTYALSCGGQESGFATLAVGNSGSASPTITLSATPNPATVGQVVTISATAAGSGATPTGTVAIMYGARTLASLPLTSGTASISPSTAGLPAGNYLLTASYSGDTNYSAAVSAGYTVTLDKATPAISLSATPNPAGIGQTVTITATASGSGAAPTGTVAFKYGSLTLASLPLSGGTASFAPSTNGLPPGTYDLTASYSGDASYGAANSSAYGITLNKDATVVALTATPSTVVQGSSCTLKATVTRSGAAGIPTGTVRFSVGSKTFATVAVSPAGVASITASTASVPVGYYAVVASYSGDGSDNGAASAAVTVYVRPAGYY